MSAYPRLLSAGAVGSLELRNRQLSDERVQAGLALTSAANAYQSARDTHVNWLQTRVSNIAATFTRASERFVQALLYLEASGEPAEVPSGHATARR